MIQTQRAHLVCFVSNVLRVQLSTVTVHNLYSVTVQFINCTLYSTVQFVHILFIWAWSWSGGRWGRRPCTWDPAPGSRSTYNRLNNHQGSPCTWDPTPGSRNPFNRFNNHQVSTSWIKLFWFDSFILSFYSIKNIHMYMVEITMVKPHLLAIVDFQNN